MPVGDDIDRRLYDTLEGKLDNLAKNIEILNESIFRLANSGGIKGRGGDAPLLYNMSSGDYKHDIFRGKDISTTRRNASDTEKRAHREYLDKLGKLLDEKIEHLNKITSGHREKEIEFREKYSKISNSIARKEVERAEYLDLRNDARGDEVVEIDKEIDSLTNDIKELRKELSKTRNDFNSIGDEINKTENEIGDLKHKIRESKDYDSWAEKTETEKRKEIATQAWGKMTSEEKAYYNNNFDQFSEAKDAQHEFNKRYDERQDLQSMIQNSGVENTAFGKITQKAITRNQRFDNMQNFGRKMAKEGGAAKLSKQLFGSGKAAGMATKAFSGLGGIVGKFGKLMGGPVIGGILMFIDAVKAIGKVVFDGMNEWAKINAEMIKMQTEQERVQYEQAKQHLVLNTQAEIEKISIAGDLAVKQTELMSQTFLEGLSIQNAAFVKSMEIGTGAMTMGVAQTAYAAAEANIDQAANIRKLELHQAQREQSFGLYQAQRQLQGEGKLANIEAERQMADVQAQIGMAEAAFNYQQFALQEASKGAGNILSGSGVVAATVGLRDETANTTTGVKGQGNVNAITGEAATVQSVNQMSDNPLIQAGDKHGMGTMMGAGFFGSNTEGFMAENQELFRNQQQKMMQSVDAMKTKTEQYYNLATTKMEYQTQLQQQVVDVNTQAAEQVIDAATAVEKNWLKTTQTIEEWLRKYDEKMNDVALNVGLWTKESMAAFKEAHLQTVKDLAQKYGKSEEEIASYQNAYTEQSGRNKLLSKEDLDKAVGLGVLVGDDTAVAKYVSEMEAFNQSAGDTAEMIKNEMNNINKLGLNARKYMKEVANNLKLANKYTFKEGTKSLREMVKWAEQTKFRMESLGGMIDKVREGGIEGVITQSAGFQVLGGMAAINSDPLGMLYDAWGDANAYAKRMQDMTKGFGTFDKKTGETLFNNIAENMQIEQIAKLQGRTGEELREEIRRRNQMEAFKASLTPGQKNSFTEDQIQYLANAATYDKENQVWKVNLLNKKTGEFDAKEVSDLNSADLENYAALSESYEDRMTTMVEELVSLVAKERGEQWFELADQAAMDYKTTMGELNKRLTEIHDNYIKERDNIHDNFLIKQKEITDSTENFLSQFAKNVDSQTSAISAEIVKIREKTGNITSALEYVAASINEAQAAINRDWEAKLNDFNGVVNEAESNAQGTVQSTNAQQTTSENEHRAMRVWKRYNTAFGHSSTDTENRVKEILKIYNDPEKRNDKTAYSAVMSTGLHDLLDAMEASGVSNTDDFDDISLEDIQNLARYAQKALDEIQNAETFKVNTNTSTYHGTHQDAVMSGNGNSMYTAASDVTSINDGSVTLAQTHPEDTGIFAKTGGPFDKLFDGVFGKISAVYDTLKSERRYGTWKEINQYPIDKYGDLPKSDSQETQGNVYGNSGNKNINLNINERLTLDSGGQSVDIMEMLRSNPDLVRKITETIILQMSSNENGGKHNMFSNRYYR